LSYFAKPNCIVYDEWFDNDLEKTNNLIIETVENKTGAKIRS